MKTTLVAVLSVLLGLAAGYAIPRGDRPAEDSAEAEANPLSGKLAAAEKRIESLEGEIASLRAKRAAARPAEAKLSLPAAADGGDDLQKTMMSLKPGDNLMEKLKGKVPEEQLAQMHDVFEKMRVARANRARGRLAFLESVDTTGMSDAERENHRKLQDLLAKREELASKLQTGIVPDMGAIAEIARVGEEMDPVAKQERSALIRQTGRMLGYTGDDVEVFHDTMVDVYDATSSGGALGTLGEMFNPAGMATAGADAQDAAVPADSF